MYFGQLSAVSSFGLETTSAVMGFDLRDKCNFTSGVPIIISALAHEEVCNKYMTKLWNLVTSDKDRGPTIFEAYTRLQMTLPNQSRDFVARFCVGASDERYKEEIKVRLGGCLSIRLAVDIVGAAMNCRGDLFHSTNKRYPLIDFIYQDSEGVLHAFQVTVGKSHIVDTTKVKSLQKKIENDNSKLRLYYLVPAENFATFVTDPVKPNVSCCVYHVMIPKPQEEGFQEPLKEIMKEADSKHVEEEDRKHVEN